jgi:hypothetical protein
MVQMHDHGLPIRGIGQGRTAKRAQTYPGDRTCGHDDCATRLSIYNRSERCWVHEPAQTYVLNTGGRPRKDRRHVAA